MKKIFLFLILFSASSALAQPSKVLVFAVDSTCYHLACIDSLSDAIHKRYSGEILKRFGSFPDSLDSFDAIFLIGLYRDDSTILKKLILLRSYLNHGGHLYFESTQFFFPMDTIFSNMIGVTSQTNYDIASDIGSVQGKDGFFTQGMNFIINRPLKEDHLSDLLLTGPCELVLTGTEAFQFQTNSYKVVFYRHFLDETYKDFIGRVTCDYFGLCASSVREKPAQRNATTTLVYPNPASDFINIQYNSSYLSPLNVDIVSSTGSVVGKRHMNQTLEGIFTLSLSDGTLPSLSQGTYFLRLTTDKEVLSVPFYLK
jgi:hypothetical protein